LPSSLYPCVIRKIFCGPKLELQNLLGSVTSVSCSCDGDCIQGRAQIVLVDGATSFPTNQVYGAVPLRSLVQVCFTLGFPDVWWASIRRCAQSAGSIGEVGFSTHWFAAENGFFARGG
jgi:hypothetical protein